MSNLIETYDKIGSESKSQGEFKNVNFSDFQNAYPGVFELGKLLSPTTNSMSPTIFKQSDFK